MEDELISMAKKKVAYNDLPFIIDFMGWNAAQDAGLSRELSERFAKACDAKCRAAYESEGDNFFKKCVRSKTNAGRDMMLHTWIPHWLEAFILNPERFENSNS